MFPLFSIGGNLVQFSLSLLAAIFSQIMGQLMCLFSAVLKELAVCSPSEVQHVEMI